MREAVPIAPVKRCQHRTYQQTESAKQTYSIHYTCEKRNLPVVLSQCTAHCQLRRCSVSPQKATTARILWPGRLKRRQ